MAVLHFSSKNKKIKLVLTGKNIVTAIIQIGAVLAMMISLGFVAAKFESFVVVLAIAIIPVLSCIFLIKLFIWNIYGTETIELTKQSLSVFHDYRYIYKPWKSTYEIDNPKLTFQTLSEGVVGVEDLDEINSVVPMKAVITPNSQDTFTTSFAIKKSDSKQLISEFQKLYNIKKSVSEND